VKKLLLIALLIVGCEEAGLNTNSLTSSTAVTDTLFVYDTLIVTNYDTTIVNNYDTLIVSNYDTSIVYDTLIVTGYDTTIVNNYDTLIATNNDTLVVMDTVYITLEDVYGCTDTTATNFDADANIFDNSCEYSAISEFTDFETIRGMDEYGNPTEIFGDGVWGGCIQDTLSGLSDEIIEDNSENDNQGGFVIIAIPVEFALSSPYPNPFNDLTSIGISVPMAGYLKVSIINTNYDTLRTIANESITPGAYTFIWNGKDNNGSQVESGYYRVIAEFGNTECFANLHLSVTNN